MLTPGSIPNSREEGLSMPYERTAVKGSQLRRSLKPQARLFKQSVKCKDLTPNPVGFTCKIKTWPPPRTLVAIIALFQSNTSYLSV